VEKEVNSQTLLFSRLRDPDVGKAFSRDVDGGGTVSLVPGG